MSVVCNTVGGWVGGHPECLYWWVLKHPTLAIGFWILDFALWILDFDILFDDWAIDWVIGSAACCTRWCGGWG